MASTSKTGKLKFRGAKIRDVAAMHALDQRLFLPHSSYELETFHEFIFSDDFSAIVADDRGELAAFVVVHHGGQRAATVITIDVQPAWQKQGIGTRLMTLAEKLARRRGKLALNLQVSADNEGAIRFYERLGYKRVRFMKGYYGGVEDGWEMKKEITGKRRSTNGK